MFRVFTAVFLVALIGWAEQSASLKPPEYVGAPDRKRAATNRGITLVPGMAVAPEGRLWAVWYAGITPKEDQNNYVVVSTSGDDGKNWKEMLAIDPDWTGPIRAYDPTIWLDPQGRLWVFWAQTQNYYDGRAGVWAIVTENPDAARPSWSKPRRLTHGIMMNKPTVLSSGEWVLPVANWRFHEKYVKSHEAYPDIEGGSHVYISEDEGRTWKLRGTALVPETQADEHMVVELKDGRLWMLVRTDYGIGQAFSEDGGRTWIDQGPSEIAHATSRFFIRRLQSGNLLLVKHGPIDERTGRSHLTAFVSTDDGKTWGGGLLLDERGVTYPDGQQAADGTIYITYDYSRRGAREILFAAFREEDAAAGSNVSGAVRLRQLISKGSGGQEEKKTDASPMPAVKDNGDGAALNKTAFGSFSLDGLESAAFSVGQSIFTDRRYAVVEVPEALEGASFLRMPLSGSKELVCAKSGMLYFLTPQKERNRPDSQASRLESQGFEKVALPEIPLFNRSHAGNFCSLYQKMCAENEEIEIGKWAVPLFFPDAE